MLGLEDQERKCMMNDSVPSAGKRVAWLDSCKGFAILLVVLGHIADGYIGAGLYPERHSILETIYNLIYCFHMPLFFMLSGYTFYLAYCKEKERKKGRFYNQLINLVWIYIAFCVLLWAFKMLFSSSVNTEFTVHDLLMIPIKPLGEFWYLYVLIFLYVICYGLNSLHFPDKALLMVLFLVSCVSMGVHFGVIFPIKNILYYLALFYMGIYLSKKSNSRLMDRKMSWFYGTGAIVSFAYIVICHSDISKAFIIGLAAATVLSLLVISVFVWIPQLQEMKLFNMLGKYSLEIYVMHTFITAGNRILLVKMGINRFEWNIAVNFLLAVSIPVVCSVLLKKMKLHTLLFRPATFFTAFRQG